MSPSQISPPGGTALPPSVGPELGFHSAVRSSSLQTPWVRNKENAVCVSLFGTFFDKGIRQSWKNEGSRFLNAALHFKPISRGVPNLEAELLGTGVHRGRLSHSRRPSEEHSVAKWSPSSALRFSLAPEISTVPHIYTHLNNLCSRIFFFWNQSISVI